MNQIIINLNLIREQWHVPTFKREKLTPRTIQLTCTAADINSSEMHTEWETSIYESRTWWKMWSWYMWRFSRKNKSNFTTFHSFLLFEVKKIAPKRLSQLKANEPQSNIIFAESDFVSNHEEFTAHVNSPLNLPRSITLIWI